MTACSDASEGNCPTKLVKFLVEDLVIYTLCLEKNELKRKKIKIETNLTRGVEPEYYQNLEQSEQYFICRKVK